MEERNNGLVSFAVAKVISLWALIGVAKWEDAAYFFGTIYSCILIGDWLRKEWRSYKQNADIAK